MNLKEELKKVVQEENKTSYAINITIERLQKLHERGAALAGQHEMLERLILKEEQERAKETDKQSEAKENEIDSD